MKALAAFTLAAATLCLSAPASAPFAKEGKHLSRKAARYAHARQFKRMKHAIKRQRTIVARLQREIERKASVIGQAVRQSLGETLNKAQRIVEQSGQRKA